MSVSEGLLQAATSSFNLQSSFSFQGPVMLISANRKCCSQRAQQFCASRFPTFSATSFQRPPYFFHRVPTFSETSFQPAPCCLTASRRRCSSSGVQRLHLFTLTLTLTHLSVFDLSSTCSCSAFPFSVSCRLFIRSDICFSEVRQFFFIGDCS